ncbi:MAG: 2-amino-4-hydroxy-6-hydroxymethyldihydropteridine diphosphokinase [Chromatiales bacterium]|jgi:2-amino-4-hydroxy-6-hydroxymethyldihydropteridine diphosphokinase|nr:2-amino-4-hydroxy-6-hydroxymethyldihydropteridine diphosphokinase [Chromatiales bacterium]
MPDRVLHRLPNPVIAYVGLGSNLDRPVDHVERAVIQLDALPGCLVLDRSPLYWSAPMGPPDQPDFVNAVARLQVTLEPGDLLRELLTIESDHGRVRDGSRWGPRTLDMDLLLYSDLTIDEPGLKVPHPGLTSRNFVVYPLLSIAPGLSMPGGEKLADIAAGLSLDGLGELENAMASEAPTS